MEELKNEISSWDHIFKADIQSAFVRMIDLLIEDKSKCCCGCFNKPPPEVEPVEPVPESPSEPEPEVEAEPESPSEPEPEVEAEPESPSEPEPAPAPAPTVVLPFHVGGQVTTA
jgi:outer membrane biosynthesis protein TonB